MANTNIGRRKVLERQISLIFPGLNIQGVRQMIDGLEAGGFEILPKPLFAATLPPDKMEALAALVRRKLAYKIGIGARSVRLVIGAITECGYKLIQPAHFDQMLEDARQQGIRLGGHRHDGEV